jgi:signal transduction histidine kinase
VFLASIIAIAGTARTGGPFAQQELRDSLYVLQTFMGIVGASFLVLSTALSERARAQEELRRALIAEAHANQAKSDFLAVVSHELRTPLNAIAGYAQMLTMQIPGPLTDKQRDAIARITSNQEHLAGLVDDVLGFVRLEAGELTMKTEPVRVSEALAAIETFIRPELRRKNITLTRPPLDDSVRVLADPERLRQILVNLLSNAAKYSEPGGTIEVGAEDDRKSTVRIYVRDRGVGIPADQLHRVFEPFFQVERGMTRRYPGVGLGLTISRDLARAMNGDVTITSVVGKGTEVSVTLPTADHGMAPTVRS